MKSLQRFFGKGRAFLFFLAMTALLAPARMMGQNTLTVYDGQVGNNLVPYSYEYRQQWQKCEFVIPATALSDLNAVQNPKAIEGLRFYHNIYGHDELCTFKVFVEEVDFASFEGQPSFHGFDNASVVYEGRLVYDSYQMEVTFDDYFIYHGGNLLVGLYTTKTWFYSASPQYFYGTTVENAAMEGCSDDPENIPANIANFIPKTTITYIDVPSCWMPKDLEIVENSITSTSVTLDWTPRGQEQEWKIKYYDENNEEVIVGGITEHPYTLTGLQPGTDYSGFSVCAVCGVDDVSDWTDFDNEFTTPFCDPDDQCELHYELWSSISWGWDEQSIRVYYKPTADESILVQELSAYGSFTEGDLLLCDGGIYNFVWYVGYTGTLDRCSFVIYGPDGEPILSYADGEAPGSGHDYEEMTLLEDYVFHCPSCEKPWDFSVDPTANSATFTWEAESGQTAWQFQYSTDQTNWNDLPTVEETGCSIGQLAPATHYYARVRSVCGVDDYSAWVRLDFYTDCGTIEVDATHPYSENFDSYDPYDPWGGGEWKGMRMEVSDRLPLCWNSWNGSDDNEQGVYPYISEDWGNGGNVLNFYVYNYEDEGAMLDQYAILPAMENIGGLMMNFRAKDAESSTTSFSVGVMTDPTDPDTYVEIQDFEVADEWDDFVVYFGTYQGQGEYMAIKVPTPGVDESYNLYIDDIEVSVMPTCFVPSGFAVSNVEENEVTLTWEPYGDETEWQVRYSTDQSTWTTVDFEEQSPGGTVTKQFTGLNVNTLYYAQVRANCGNEDYSAWSAIKSFRTLCGEYQPVPYYEDCESYQYPDLPQCWDKINTATDESNSKYPLVSNSYINGESSMCLQFQFYKTYYYTPKDQTALLPRMENISSLQLSFEGCRTSVMNNHTADYKPVQVGVYDEEDVFHSIATIDLSTEALTNYTVTFEDYTGTGDIGRIAIYVPYFISGWTQYYVYIDNVSVTENSSIVHKPIEAYTADDNGWNLIASPVLGSLQPSAVENMVSETEEEYDLYAFDQNAMGAEWLNYKVHGFNLQNGQGYLYANSNTVTLSFAGAMHPSTLTSIEVPLVFVEGKTYAGWNLVGNPFDGNATLGNTDFYRINGNVLEASNGEIEPCEGVFVQATATGQTVTFTRVETAPAEPETDVIDFGLYQGSMSHRLDLARIRFSEGSNLCKLDLLSDPNKLYIPIDDKDYAVVHVGTFGELPLNFKAAENGHFTLAANFGDVEVRYLHLIDNLTGNDIDLLETPSYTFEARTTDYASRFRLVFNANEDGPSTGSATFAYFNGSGWVISNTGEATLQVIDVLGRVLSSQTISGNAEVNVNQPSGVYMLRLVSGDDVRVQKVVIK